MNFIQIAISKQIVTTAIKVCIIVGTILNLINHGDQIIAMDWGAMNWPKLFMTYSVPYLVATYSGTMVKLKMQ